MRSVAVNADRALFGIDQFDIQSVAGVDERDPFILERFARLGRPQGP